EIMAGKLFSATAAVLTTVVLWAAGLFLLAQLLWPGSGPFLLEGVKSSVFAEHFPFIVVYFLSGLLIYGSIFLAIGSMAATLADAQALSGPATMIIMLPNILLSVLLRDPSGLVATAVSWIPIYSPYFMLFRLPSHPPEYQIWATAALSAATALFLVLRMGRVF